MTETRTAPAWTVTDGARPLLAEPDGTPSCWPNIEEARAVLELLPVAAGGARLEPVVAVATRTGKIIRLVRLDEDAAAFDADWAYRQDLDDDWTRAMLVRDVLVHGALGDFRRRADVAEALAVGWLVLDAGPVPVRATMVGRALASEVVQRHGFPRSFVLGNNPDGEA